MTDVTFEHMCALAAENSPHRDWRLCDAVRLFIPPIRLGQVIWLPDGDGFATYGFFTGEAVTGYVNRTRKLQPEDWNAGEQLWIIDFIAPGKAAQLARRVRHILHDILGAEHAHWQRTYPTVRPRKLGWVDYTRA